MIETLVTALDGYGLVGVMITMMIFAIVYLAKRDEKRDAKLQVVIENNTVALTRFSEMTKKCEVKK